MKNINNYNILRTQVLLMFAFVIILTAVMANEKTDYLVEDFIGIPSNI